MKKFTVLLSIILVATSVSFAQKLVTVSPNISFDIAGNHKVSLQGRNGSMSVNPGVTLGLEITSVSENVFSFGGGVMYLIPREQEVSGSGEFNFMPVYALGKIKFTTNESGVVPSLILNIGYNVLYNGDSNYKGPLELSGGLYLAGGIRFDINKIYFQGIYKAYNGSASMSGVSSSFDVTYTTLSLGFGVSI